MNLKTIIRPKKLEWEKVTSDNTYGKFIAEPFERGYGHTIGNSLRRILLSSLDGAAVTSVKIDKVLQEFSTIKGVGEDVVAILLNLKSLRLKMFTDGPETLTLKSNKAGKLRAKDIEPNNNIEILNPDLHIATLSSSGKIDMVMEVNKGRGYVPAEKNKKEGQPIGVIPLDAIFTPVHKVAYTVENARIGQVTDYDRLIMEIWTDGSVVPADALAYAAKIQKDLLNIFINFEEEEDDTSNVQKAEDKEHQKIKELLMQSVDIIELSVRSSNCLQVAKIKTLGALVSKTEQDLLKVKNFGKKSLNEIGKKLKELGLSLGMQIPK
ncbi:MAG: DNA-directed RNA polymerase subunit alpha [bacterium]